MATKPRFRLIRAATWQILLAATILFFAFLGSLAHAQTVSTDQSNYLPGNTVSIIGSGWQPGETVNLAVSNTGTDPTMSLSATADSGGNFENEGYTIPDDTTSAVTYTVTASDSSGATVQSTFVDATDTADLCSAVSGHGLSVCPSATPPAAGVLGQGVTHYAQQVGSTVTYELIWVTGEDATAALPFVEASNASICPNQVKVQIKSSVLGNTIVCGTESTSGSETIVTFSYQAPANGCQTTIVAYKTGTTRGGEDQFTNADNDIVADDTDDGTPTASAGIGYVATGTSGPALACGGLSLGTTIFDSGGGAVTGLNNESVYDVATITAYSGPTPNGTINFTFFSNGNCTSSGTSAGSGIALSGNPLSATSNTEGPLGNGSYSFQATYVPGTNDAYSETQSGCEPLTIEPPPPTCSTNRKVTTKINGVANGVDGGGNPVPLSFNFGTSITDDATFTETLSCSSGSKTASVAGTLVINYYANGTCTGTPMNVNSDTGSVSGSLSAPPDDTFTQDETSTAQACLNAGSYSFQAVFTDSSDNSQVVSSCEPFNITAINPNICTTVKLDPINQTVTTTCTNPPTTGSVTMGAKVHDTVTVTDPSSCTTPTGTANFTFYADATCGTKAAVPPAQNPNPQTGVALSAGGASSLSTSALGAGAYSYKAHYTGDGVNFNGVDSICEPLKVTSSITAFNYSIKGVYSGTPGVWNSSKYENPSGPYTCHTDEVHTIPPSPFSFSIPDPATCGNWKGSSCPLATPPLILDTSTSNNAANQGLEGLVAQCLKAGTCGPVTNDYLITAQVTDNTGGAISEKVNGLLTNATYADSSGNVYTPVLNTFTVSQSDICDVTNPGSPVCGSSANCGCASVTLNSTSNGNVTWGAKSGGSCSTTTGFAMTQGQVCQLQLIARKPMPNQSSQCYTSSTAPVKMNVLTGSWTEKQTAGKTITTSPNTGQLLVDVDGSGKGIYH